MLKGDNGGILSLKIFGCVCFVKDNRPTVGKLDPRTVRCIFVGYFATHKGYVCWSHVERRLFVSMDVTFREFESYYSSEVTSPFGDSSDTGGMRREGENGERLVNVGSIPCPGGTVEEEQEYEEEEEPVDTRAQGELRVFTRRRRQNEVPVTTPAVPLVPSSPLFRSISTFEAPTSSTSDSDYTSDMIPLPSPPALMTLRRTSRSNAGHPPDRLGFPHDLLSLSHTLT